MTHDPARYGDAIAESYDQRFRALEPDSAAVEFLVEHAGGGPVLELGIGTGRVALPLAARGLVVHGVDSSQAMVDRLRAKPGGDRVAVAIGDFKDTAPPGSEYGLVFCAFNTIFGLLTQEDQVVAVRNAAARLRPGGRLVLECFVPDLGRFDRGQRLSVMDLPETGVRIEASRHDAATQRIETRDLLLADGRVEEIPISIRYAWPSELDLMARLAGLSLESRWSSWERSPFDSRSKSHVSVYRKPAA
jgi:SAM-dependent methyltransferase